MSMASLVPEKQACRHLTTEYLGSDGVAEFYRCQGCRHVVVVQGTRLWMLEPAVAA